MKNTLQAVIAVLLLTMSPAVCDSSKTQRTDGPVPNGAVHYEKLCAGCHGDDGRASDEEAPPLAGSSWVSGPESRLIRIVMHGVTGPMRVANRVYNREMPGFGSRLSDREMALLLTYVRRRWGTPDTPITRKAVGQVRAASRNRKHYWTVEELLAFK